MQKTTDKKTSRSIALFDEVITPKASEKKEVHKKVKAKTSKNDVLKHVESSRKPKTKKTSQAQIKPVKNDNKQSNSDSRKSRRVDRTESNSVVKAKAKPEQTSGKKSGRTSNTEQKSKVAQRASSSRNSNTVKAKSVSTENRNIVKKHTAVSKRKERPEFSLTGGDKGKGRITKGTRAEPDTSKNVAVRIPEDTGQSEVYRESKKLWKKRKRELTNRIPPPKRITGKPKQVGDDFSIVAINVGGEYMEVSSWSVIDGVYYPGKDSEFLVHRLCYDIGPDGKRRKRK